MRRMQQEINVNIVQSVENNPASKQPLGRKKRALFIAMKNHNKGQILYQKKSPPHTESANWNHQCMFK